MLNAQCVLWWHLTLTVLWKYSSGVHAHSVSFAFVLVVPIVQGARRIELGGDPSEFTPWGDHQAGNPVSQLVLRLP